VSHFMKLNLGIASCAFGLLSALSISHAHASSCRNGYRLSSAGVCISTRDIRLECDSDTYDGRDYQLLLHSYPGRKAYCFRNVGGDQSNIIFGQVQRSPGCLYQHPSVDGRGASAVVLDFCDRGPRDVFLESLSDIVCEDSAGAPAATCHRFYHP
jgi:hypothetical protein